MKAYLLYEDRDFDFGGELPSHHEDLVQDLNLVTLLEAMAQGDAFLFEVSKRVLLTSLTDPAAIRYRQDILTDCIAEPDAVRSMYATAVGALEDKRSSGIGGLLSSQNPAVTLSGAVRQLEVFVVRLQQLRAIADDHVSRFRSDGLSTLCHTLQRELSDEYFEEINRHLKQLRFPGGELLSARLGWDNSGVDYVLRSPANASSRWQRMIGRRSRDSYSFAVSPRDEAGGQALGELTNRGISLVANAVAQSADHISSYFTMLRGELGFYVSCLNLHERLATLGGPTSFPVPSPWSQPALSCSGLCDVALLLQTGGGVVGNDVEAGAKPLVVITGANSGGKSTFLRSLGMAQMMMQCGLFVAAESYRANVCEGVFTHFIREEDATMTSGRLDEELARMSGIADDLRPRCLVLFNESFAATNEREGSEIARQIVGALLEADVKVAFVTHQFDFAESVQLHHADAALFMRAERQADGRRNFKLVEAPPLPTSFGEDLYYRLGRWLGESEQPRAPAP